MDETKTTYRFSGRDWLALALGLALALLWREVFSLANLTYGLPALGAAAFTFAAWVAVALVLGKGAKWTRANIFLAVVINLLALSCAFQWSQQVRLLNFLVILCGSVMGFLSLADVGFYPLTEARSLSEGVWDCLRGIFKNWGKPFSAIAALAPGERKNIGGVALGLLMAAPVLLVVISGLAVADVVFGALFGRLFDWLEGLDALGVLMRTLWTAVLTLAFFSALFFLRHEPKRSEGQEKLDPLPLSALITILALLTAVCAVFAAVQFKYLFGGEEAAAMSGGWAEYARSGFFSLVGVAAIVMATALACSRAGRESLIGRVLVLALIALTFVILASAAYRLYLYVTAYGLSVMRLMAAWAILATGVCLVLTAVKTINAGFRFWPWAAGCVLVMWLCFAFAPLGSIIASYNVDAYLGGRLEQVDATYLYSLGPGSLEPLRELRASGLEWNDGTWPDDYLDNLIDNLENPDTPRWSAAVLG